MGMMHNSMISIRNNKSLRRKGIRSYFNIENSTQELKYSQKFEFDKRKLSIERSKKADSVRRNSILYYLAMIGLGSLIFAFVI